MNPFVEEGLSLFLNIVALLFGTALAGWSSWMIVGHFRTPREHRRKIGWLIFLCVIWLIGVGDTAKAIKDLSEHGQEDPEIPAEFRELD